MKDKKMQEEIFIDVDFKSGEIINDWKRDKLKTILIGESFKRLNNEKKALRLFDCGTYLEFKRFLSDNERRLFRANFCKVRLCPMCMKRRSKKIYGQASKVMNVAQNKYEFLFLTLTIKNCKAEDLKETLDLMFKSWTKMFRRAAIQKAVKGWFRGLEVTHNLDHNSESYNTFHPHFHVILAVNKSYFKSKNYLKQSDFKELWKSCLGVDYDPIVDVRRFRASDKKELAKSLAEATKYTVKDSDFIINEDIILTDCAIYTLDQALANRRLTAWGGELKEIHKQLNLDDAEDGDLVNTDNEDEIREDLNYIIECVGWNFGLSNYYINDIRIPEDLYVCTDG